MFLAPYYYMPMPVNKDGNGPADEADTYRIFHEVWDGNCETVCECASEEAARWVAQQLSALPPIAPAIGSHPSAVLGHLFMEDS